jgi:aspartyl-tRNA(Asn)/glutamyl-tRNA(Gln) amidotransferase subunit C
MSITLDDVHKVAELANLHIEEIEAMLYLKNLQEILKLATQIDKVDTGSTQAIAHSFDTNQRLRLDKITEKNQRDQLQQLSSHVQAGLYIVPAVIE